MAITTSKHSKWSHYDEMSGVYVNEDGAYHYLQKLNPDFSVIYTKPVKRLDYTDCSKPKLKLRVCKKTDL